MNALLEHINATRTQSVVIYLEITIVNVRLAILAMAELAQVNIIILQKVRKLINSQISMNVLLELILVTMTLHAPTRLVRIPVIVGLDTMEMAEHALVLLFSKLFIYHIFTQLLDINECSTGTHTCHSDAVCTNTPGSHTCRCRSGYNGDGRTCTGTSFNHITIISINMLINFADINECTSGTHTCSTNAQCTNTPGSFSCTCNSGYSGNGYSCTGIYFIVTILLFILWVLIL